MSRLKLLVALTLVAVLSLALACGDDDDAGNGASPTPSPTAGATATPDGEPTASPDDVTTPPDEKTPIGGGNGDGNGDTTGPTPEPTQAATPAPEGIPAVHIENISSWLAENYPGVSPRETTCTFNPATVIANCDGALYAVDPPLTGQDVSCSALRVNDEPVAIRCTSQVPLTTIYYAIQ